MRSQWVLFGISEEGIKIEGSIASNAEQYASQFLLGDARRHSECK